MYRLKSRFRQISVWSAVIACSCNRSTVRLITSNFQNIQNYNNVAGNYMDNVAVYSLSSLINLVQNKYCKNILRKKLVHTCHALRKMRPGFSGRIFFRSSIFKWIGSIFLVVSSLVQLFAKKAIVWKHSLFGNQASPNF